MTGAVLSSRPQRRLGWIAQLVAFGVLALWTALVLSLDAGVVHLPGSRLWRFPFVIGVPLLGLLLLVLRPDTNRAVKTLVGGTWLVAAAIVGSSIAMNSPTLVFGLIALCVAAVACGRWPAQTVLAAFAISGAYGSINAFTPLETGPTVDLLLGALWVGLALRMLSRRRDYKFVLWPGVLAILAYSAFTAASVLFAPDLYEGMRAFRQSTWYMLALVVVAYLGLRSPTRNQLAVGIVAVCALIGAYASLRWAIGPSGKESALAATTGDVKYDVAAGETKLQGSLPNGSILGLWTAVTIPFCFAAALGMRGKARVVAMLAVPLLTIGLFGSQVRTGLVAAVIGVGLVLVLYQLSRGFKGPRLGTVGAALISFALIALVVFPNTAGDTPEKVERYSYILTPSRDRSWQERRFKWDSALRESVRAPLGRGLGTAGIRASNQRFPASETGGDVDNSYVMVAFEQGFVVMVFLIAALAVLLAGLARRAVWTLSGERATIAVGAAGTLAALMMMFVSRLYIESLASLAAWIIIGLGVAQFSRVDGELPARAP